MNFEAINTECPICLNSLSHPCTIGCTHLFCKYCMEKWLDSDSYNSHKCPVCRKNYISLFLMPETFMNSRYKTRSVTGAWRSMQLYINIWKIIDNIKNLSTQDEKCDELNTMLQYIYDNKWVLYDVKTNNNPNHVNIFATFSTTLKERLKSFSENDLWCEAKVWEYKFRDILK